MCLWIWWKQLSFGKHFYKNSQHTLIVCKNCAKDFFNACIKYVYSLHEKNIDVGLEVLKILKMVEELQELSTSPQLLETDTS